MNSDQNADASTTLDQRRDEMKGLLEEFRKEIVGGLTYTHSQANANTHRALETATFLFALVEVLAEKGVLTIEELDARKDEIADRVQRRFLSKGMGVVLQEPEQDKYAFAAEAQVDCENRVHLCKAACCRMLFPLSRQDIAERIVMWDLEAPYLIAQTEDGWCRHLDRAACKCTVREHRPIPCRAYDCRNDPRIWSDFANYAINPDLDRLFDDGDRAVKSPSQPDSPPGQ
jgi:Fe-S-cluster containining protein